MLDTLAGVDWEIVEIETPHGPARAHRAGGATGGTSGAAANAVAAGASGSETSDAAAAATAPVARLGDAAPAAPRRARTAPRGTLVLGHGAGGSITAPDLQAVAAAVVAAGFDVVLVEQPYRVAGRKAAAPAKQLDVAWLAVLEHLQLGAFAAAEDADASTSGEIASAGAPLIVGGRSSGARVACRTATASGAAGVLCLAFPLITPKGASRQEELDAAGAPVLVVQGTTDRFGMPEPDAALHRAVIQVSGDHGLKRDHTDIATAVTDWLAAAIARR